MNYFDLNLYLICFFTPFANHLNQL